MPIKKLKLIKKPLSGITNSLVTVVGHLEDCKTSNEALTFLLGISEKIEIDAADISEVVKKLRC